jgi:hypothetical protein
MKRKINNYVLVSNLARISPVSYENARMFNKRGSGAGLVPSMESLTHMQHIIELHAKNTNALKSRADIAMFSPTKASRSEFSSPSSSRKSTPNSGSMGKNSSGVVEEGISSWANTFSLGNLSPMRLPFLQGQDEEDNQKRYDDNQDTEETTSRRMSVMVQRKESLGGDDECDDGTDLFVENTTDVLPVDSEEKFISAYNSFFENP